MVKQAAVYVMLAVSLIGCSRPVRWNENRNFYFEIPRQVYVEDQVMGLEISDLMTDAATPFVSIRTMEGNEVNGKLLDITERDLIVDEGITPANQTTARAHQTVVAKNEVLILKIWPEAK